MSEPSASLSNRKTPLSSGRRNLKRRRWIVRVLAIGLAVTLGMLLAEVGLRLFVADTRSPYIYDEFTGTRLKPGHRFVFQSEGYSANVISSQGLRDREHSLEKPAGTFRIAVLGDSFSEALQVSQEKTFWAVLERELQAKPQFRDRTVEVINFGVSGFGTVQEWQMLDHYARAFSPDLVLLAFLPGNDVRNNSRELEPDHRRPFADIVDDQLKLDNSFRDDPVEKRFREWTVAAFKDQTIRRSRLVHLLYRALEDWRARRAARANAGKAGGAPKDSKAEEAGIDDAVFAPPKNEAWRSAWQITDRVLKAMHDDSRDVDAKFVVVMLNNSVEVHPDPAVSLAVAEKLGVQDLNEPQRQLTASSERYGFPLIKLRDRMRAIAQKDGVCFHGFPNAVPCGGHWNEQGHKTAGELIADDLAKLLEGENVSVEGVR